MGGGDLNSKKSWHPNTIKNQERVWKAEKAAAMAKQRIVELQRERAEERDRSELIDLVKQTAGASGDSRLSWMYNKPDKKGHQEDYLLGKTIDSNFDDNKGQDAIPAVSRRVVGSSLLSSGNDTQVDLVRKMREDPLVLVKERERAARAALLNNPLQRKKLTELLRKEQEQRKEKNAPKENKHKDLDDKLAAKLSALGESKLNLASLLASDDSSSESSSDEKSKKKKHKKDKKAKKKRKEKKSEKNIHDVSEQDSSDNNDYKGKQKRKKQSKEPSNHTDYIEKSIAHGNDTISSYNSQSYAYLERGDKKFSQGSSYRARLPPPDAKRYEKRRKLLSSRSQRSPSDERQEKRVSGIHSQSIDRADDQYRPHSHGSSRNDGGDLRKPDRHSSRRDRNRSVSTERESTSEGVSRRRRSSPEERRDSKKAKGLSAAEREARLAEMARAGAQHEVERSARVAHQRSASQAEESAPHRAGAATADARALPQSLEARIHSNRHNIQRNERHMNEHFARR